MHVIVTPCTSSCHSSLCSPHLSFFSSFPTISVSLSPDNQIPLPHLSLLAFDSPGIFPTLPSCLSTLISSCRDTKVQASSCCQLSAQGGIVELPPLPLGKPHIRADILNPRGGKNHRYYYLSRLCGVRHRLRLLSLIMRNSEMT
jgi:hypothetical protein